MRAVIVDPPGSLRLSELPDPVAGPGEVLVRVAAAGVNRADVMQRRGKYPSPPGAPEHPGLEVSGWVAALGPGVSGWRVGEPVCALLAGGGYGELVAVPVGQVLPVPAGVPVEDAAALPEVACTVWSNVFTLAGLRPGESLLVHGGSSGIGTMAIQLARQVGARVAVTAGSAEKLEACAALGAELLVNYRTDDFVAAVRAWEPAGADVVLDVVGAPYLARNVEVLATNGRLVVIATQGGTSAEVDLGTLMRKRISLHATTLRARPTAEKAAIVASVRDHVWPLVADGAVRPVVHERFALADAARAHEVLEGSAHVGKLLLLTGAEPPVA
ncbi:NAD(P)H-quinone oxidoreductase [Kineococcus sp. SYSU DK001]|uniref:NAD(P)H-quinone oxidoreductase n=1 Tax=Kineococcus sp. SYSU DK001 TaxID=3383122 RepID=UPI003D7F0585